MKEYPEIVLADSAHLLVDGLELDLDALSSYYDSLTHTDKPALGELTILFSGLGYRLGGEFAGLNAFYSPNPVCGENVGVPEINRTSGPTVLVGLGAKAIEHLQDQVARRGVDTESLAHAVDRTLKHEVAHHAQTGEDGATFTPAYDLSYAAYAELDYEADARAHEDDPYSFVNFGFRQPLPFDLNFGSLLLELVDPNTPIRITNEAKRRAEIFSELGRTLV